MGYWEFQARPPRFGVFGAIAQGGEFQPNPDVSIALSGLQSSLMGIRQYRDQLARVGLSHKVIELSYMDADSAIAALASSGVNTLPSFKPPSPEGDKPPAGAAAPASGGFPDGITFDDLPLVAALPAPAAETMALVGAGGEKEGPGQFGATVLPARAHDLAADMDASPANRLMVMFHPAHPEQFSRVQQLIEDVIDRPARQVYVEGIILEISSAGLKELGIQWEFRDTMADLTIGTLTAVAPNVALDPTLDLTHRKLANLRTDWAAKIKALVAEGKAEVMGRPSVLALNNRQASIRLGRDIPIATSQEGLAGNVSKIAFDFKYLPLGILLNLRPRISTDDREISMMIETVVATRDPDGDLEITDVEGNVLAVAPTVDTRRVQTYARVQNNTPFVVGGLKITRDISIIQKVPYLGDLPYLGHLFRTTQDTRERTEVIIVLTPYIVPEELHLSRALPKGPIDDIGSNLSRDAVRILPADIQDVRFLYQNNRFRQLKEAARQAIAANYRLAEREPFRSFAKGRAPGESVLISHIVYNFTRRLQLERPMLAKELLVPVFQPSGELHNESLRRILAAQSSDAECGDFFASNPQQAIALTFRDPVQAATREDLRTAPAPEITVVDCADRTEWERRLWELNQPMPDGRRQYTVLIHRPEDLSRLQRAAIVKLLLELNGGRVRQDLLNFVPGRMLEVPDLTRYDGIMLDAEIARYFFYSTPHFFTTAVDEVDRRLLELERELQQHGPIPIPEPISVGPEPARPLQIPEPLPAPRPTDANRRPPLDLGRTDDAAPPQFAQGEAMIVHRNFPARHSVQRSTQPLGAPYGNTASNAEARRLVR